MEKAVAAYQNVLNLRASSQTRVADFLIIVPGSLFEIAKVYESFGAFEGALRVLAMLVEYFPDYAQLDEVLFRSVVIMKYISRLPGSRREEIVSKCQEFLDKLMEINDGK